ncbi:MAG: site-specific DNA-methyltransferase [Candidatus Firestonebacteria bacterium]
MNNMESNYFIIGNAIEELKKLPTKSIDLICTDPPYNLGKDYGNNIDWKQWHEYEQFTLNWLTESKRILKDSGSIYVFMGVKFISRLFLMLQELGFYFNGWIIWHYTQGMGRTKGFSPRHEDILYFTKSEDFIFNIDDLRIPQKYFRERNNMKGANPGDVWEFSHVHYSNPERVEHPTQKPEALMKRIILASSNKDDVVLDPFVGSGTTCVVANFLTRKWIGFDINPDYIKVAKDRVKKEMNILDSFDPREARTPKDSKTNNNNQASLLIGTI